ncbi:MAG TPA: hypothetical protein VNU01_12415 [Egibacteraceae bacterium]|nr:hypothetical protein [Egibacteraceae bacterium]
MSSLLCAFLRACVAAVPRAGRGPAAVWASPGPAAVGSVRLGQLAAGVLLIGTGVGAMLSSGLGVGAWDAFHVGVSGAFGVPLWAAIAGTGAVTLAAGVALGGRPRWGTFAPLCVGPVVQATMGLLPAPGNPLQAWLLLAVGVGVVATGAGAYLTAGCGVGPFDLVFHGLNRRGLPLTAARLCVDGAALVVGALLGGPVGAGTVAATVALGLLIPATVRRFERYAPAPRLSARRVLVAA